MQTKLKAVDHVLFQSVTDTQRPALVGSAEDGTWLYTMAATLIGSSSDGLVDLPADAEIYFRSGTSAPRARLKD